MTLALKLVLTPALIAIATLAGRRFGPSIGGWLVGLPFTSGPVSLFLALEQGTSFAAAAALGAIGLIAEPPALPAAVPPPRWDLPARMIVATSLVVAITGVAPILGP